MPPQLLALEQNDTFRELLECSNVDMRIAAVIEKDAEGNVIPPKHVWIGWRVWHHNL